MTRRGTVLAAILLALLAAAALWSHGQIASARAAAAGARADLEACYQSAAQIAAYRQRPALAAEREQLFSETTGQIERAARAASIPAERLVRIAPGSPERIGNSPYREKPTHVTLKRISLQQVVAMLHHLGSGERGLRAKSIRVAAADRRDAEWLWDADLVASYLIYEPRGTGK
jgi:hypothetical protein